MLRLMILFVFHVTPNYPGGLPSIIAIITIHNCHHYYKPLIIIMISPHDHIPGGLAHHDRLPLLHHVLRCLLLRQELLRQDVEIMFFQKFCKS